MTDIFLNIRNSICNICKTINGKWFSNIKMYFLILENLRFFNIYKGILLLENHFLIILIKVFKY